jgi:ZIP family zinc transporter
MPEVMTIIVLTVAAGICMPIGGALATGDHILPNWLEKEFRHSVIAFGGGILLCGVTKVLVPEGMSGMNDSPYAIVFILLGGATFFYIERKLGLRRQQAPQLMGMLLDFIPEALALGGLVASGSRVGPLLALLIGMQNLPEGFNAYREISQARQYSPQKTLVVMLKLVLLGPLAGLSGYYFLSNHEIVLSAIMLFASGGILYLIFQDIAPQSRLNRSWAPPLGAVLGFCFALYSDLVLTGA